MEAASMHGSRYCDNPYKTEMIDVLKIVQLAAPSPKHNRVVVNITQILGRHFKGKSCQVFAEGVEVHLFNDDDYVMPDLLVLCDPNKIKDNGIYGSPDLIAEVLSPSTANMDRGRKKELYAKAGVKEYWIVDHNAKSVEVHVLDNEQYVLDYVYYVFNDYDFEGMTEEKKESFRFTIISPAFPELSIELSEVFEHIR